MTDLSDQIETASGQPKQAAVDGNMATAHSLPDQIKVDKYLAKKAAAASTSGGLGIRIGRFNPPGVS